MSVRVVRVAAGLGLLLSTSACSLFHSNAPVTQIYVLRSTVQPQEQLSPRFETSIRVARPLTDPGLDTSHIILMEADHRMNYYAGSQWPSNLPQLLEAMTVAALRSSGQYATVQDSASMFPADYVVQLAIRHFEADYSDTGSAPQVRVMLDCTVGKRAGREILASFMAEGSASASANRLSEVVSAFEVATNQALAAVSAGSAGAVRDSLAHAAPTDQKVDKPVPSITR